MRKEGATCARFSCHLLAGLRFKITDNVTADAGYRFNGILDATIRGDPAFFAPHGKASFYNHSFIGGVAVGF